MPPNWSPELAGESDRSSIILFATLLDDALIYRLSKSLVIEPNENQFDYIFRFEGPLGSFSARTEIAYLFDVIDDITHDQLNDIREMRSACAHSKQSMTFANKELAAVAKRLFSPRGFTPLGDGTPKDIRDSFILEGVVIFNILVEGSPLNRHR